MHIQRTETWWRQRWAVTKVPWFNVLDVFPAPILIAFSGASLWKNYFRGGGRVRRSYVVTWLCKLSKGIWRKVSHLYEAPCSPSSLHYPKRAAFTALSTARRLSSESVCFHQHYSCSTWSLSSLSVRLLIYEN